MDTNDLFASFPHYSSPCSYLCCGSHADPLHNASPRQGDFLEGKLCGTSKPFVVEDHLTNSRVNQKGGAFLL